MGTSDHLRALAASAPADTLGLYTVVGLTTDPAQVIVTDGDTRWPVACLDSYTVRARGDRVLTVRLDGGTWLALGKVGGAFPTPDALVSATDAVSWAGSTPQRVPLLVDTSHVLAWTHPGVATVVTGETVVGMALRVTRTDEGHPAPLRLALHSQSGAPTLTDPWDAGPLVPGQSALIPIPATQRALVATGSGIAAYTDTDHQAWYEPAADLHIDFA